MPPTQSCMAVVTGCRSQRSVRVEWKHLQLLQACIKVLCQMYTVGHPGARQQQGGKQCNYCRMFSTEKASQSQSLGEP